MRLFLCTGLLRMAALLVPRKARSEWLQEWRSELWHVWQICNQDSAAHRQREITSFTLGAFQDALWLRRDYAASRPRIAFRAGTPARCILTLAIATTACILFAYSRPSVWSLVRPYSYHDAKNLVMIARGGFESSSGPTMQLSEYEEWRRNSGHLFTGMAFYELANRHMQAAPVGERVLPIARASANLFTLLGVPIAFEVSSKGNRVFLTRSVWGNLFKSDIGIFGRTFRVDGQQAVVAGLIEDEYWRLPGKTGIWLLQDAGQIASMNPDTVGYLVAHVAPSMFPVDGDGRRQMYVPRKEEGYDWFTCESISERVRRPFSVFLFGLLLACLALPATTSLPLGEYPDNSNQVPWTTKVRRWAFLSLKFSLIVPLVYFGSFDVAYGGGSLSVDASELLELASTFWGLLLAFRWALGDQRKRCPVCLRTLTNPARVGQFSRNFLAWNGTELVCLSGHGLLHVPDLSTSWFGSQRWLYLDPSWTSLFPLGT
jgi:hypothetical protein